MELSGGQFLPPVQKLVATIIFAPLGQKCKLESHLSPLATGTVDFTGVYDILQLDKLEFDEVIYMKSHRKKMIAPIVVSAIMILYYVVYFDFLISLIDGVWKYMLGIIPFLLSAVMVKVCIERISEIRKGEEDDIGKY